MHDKQARGGVTIDWPHSSHEKGFSPVWMRMCTCKNKGQGGYVVSHRPYGHMVVNFAAVVFPSSQMARKVGVGSLRGNGERALIGCGRIRLVGCLVF